MLLRWPSKRTPGFPAHAGPHCNEEPVQRNRSHIAAAESGVEAQGLLKQDSRGAVLRKEIVVASDVAGKNSTQSSQRYAGQSINQGLGLEGR